MKGIEYMDSEELMILATALSIQLIQGRDYKEIRVLSNIAIAVAGLLNIASSQQENFDNIFKDLTR